jgi:hypothetical protein
MEKSSEFQTMENPTRLVVATVVSPNGQGEKRMARVADDEQESKKQKQNVSNQQLNIR